MAKAVMSAFARCQALNEKGEKVALASFWKHQPAIFVFLRHFSCVASRAHADLVWQQRAEYERYGGKLIFSGNGSATCIAKFKRDLGIEDATVLTDPSLEAFRAAGFERGFLASHGLSSLGNGLKLYLKGYRQFAHHDEDGDRFQLGGVLVISMAGQIRYQYISQATGDFPPGTDVEIMASGMSSKREPVTFQDVNYSIR